METGKLVDRKTETEDIFAEIVKRLGSEVSSQWDFTYPVIGVVIRLGIVDSFFHHLRGQENNMLWKDERTTDKHIIKL